MQEALNLIIGILAKQPQIKDVNRDGMERMISNNVLFIDAAECVSVPITAWDDVAIELARYNKGDVVHCIGVPNSSVVCLDGVVEPVLGFKLIQIDHEQQLEKLLQERLERIME